MKNIVIYIISVFIITSCLDKIELDTNQTLPRVVVDGVFSSIYENQVIRLSSSTFVENQIIEPLSGAAVFVEDQKGNRIQFIESEPGEYATVSQAIEGEEYNLKIILSDGDILTSRVQSVPETFELDSISIVDSLTVFIDEDGKQRRLNSIHFFAHAFSENINSDLYLRYDINTAYQVSEIICSPFKNPATCYIYNDERPQSVELLNLDANDNSISLRQPIYFRPIDFYFGEVFGLDVGLLSYNFEEYNYWVDLKSLFDQNGNITDILPGKLIGNVTSSNGKDVLGQFAVVGKSRVTKLVRNSDFSITQNPFCGVPGIPPWPLPDECCNCLAFPNSTLNRPDYWP